MSAAWVIDLGAGRRFAVALRQLVQLEQAPQTRALPFAPEAAEHVLLWNGHCVPVLDFGAWLNEQPTSQRDLLGIYAYWDAELDSHRFGALWLAGPPMRVELLDSQVCDLPPNLSHWRGFCQSCVELPALGPVPIVDMARLFQAPPSAFTEGRQGEWVKPVAVHIS